MTEEPTRLDASLLQPGYSTAAREGYYAEFHPDGTLKLFGFFAGGRPQGWVLTVDADGRTGAVEKVTRDEYRDPAASLGEGGDAEGEGDLEDLEDDGGFPGWVRYQLGRIYGDAGYSTDCSFCGKGRTEVRRMIAGPTCYICDECVSLCHEILSEEAPRPSA